ncbi:PREDICTED: uncharacterized protein LOC105147219 [Acromyrmex echinatior]|uniref:uncharacterized protein LOC105147219 n=1 Tax=Acromyrmex echinatior TaxID=103372 RepID=UPI000580D101|nr:PREDICTED: uncharacterized protein LOC105147219 [Acromyrmex echinatior]
MKLKRQGDRCCLANDLFQRIGSSYAVSRVGERRRIDEMENVRSHEERERRKERRSKTYSVLRTRIGTRMSPMRSTSSLLDVMPGRNTLGVEFVLQCHPDDEYWECPASMAPATRDAGAVRRWWSTGEERVHLFPSGHVSTELERIEGETSLARTTS